MTKIKNIFVQTDKVSFFVVPVKAVDQIYTYTQELYDRISRPDCRAFILREISEKYKREIIFRRDLKN